MLRPGKGAASALPNYAGVSSTMSIPSGGAYGGGYGSSSTSYESSSSANVNYSAGGFSRHYDDTFKDKPARSRNNSDFVGALTRYAKVPMAWALGSSVLFFLLTVHYRGQLNWILRSFEAPNARGLFDAFHDAQGHLTRCRDDVTSIQSSEHGLNGQVADLEEELKKLEKERNKLKRKVQKFEDEGHLDHIDALTARDFAWKDQVEVLQNATQRESRRSAIELFGPGPHHVKFSVILPSDEEEKERHFTIEMAPLDVMPHAVHFFLQQVVHGLWNNAWFYLNGPHVMQGGPQATEDAEELWHMDHKEDDDRAVALREFREAYLDSLAFPEYSEKFPHEKWTLGFTGRPGGPDFYINKMDNTKAHGPGGQHQHDLSEYGDPCFAKVVDGFDTLNMIIKEPTYPDHDDWGWFFEDPVHIVSATIMEDAPLKVEVAKESTDHSRKSSKPLKKPRIESAVAP